VKNVGRLFWLLALGASTALADDELDAQFLSSTLVIEATQDACYHFDIYLALNQSQRARGLMYVRKLPKFSGMLFVYEEEEPRSMWMKNTYLPLDILFIKAEGRVSSAATHTEPLSLRSIASIEPVLAVLELNAGTVDKLHLGAGSLVLLQDVSLPEP
jgi:uncharacterized membrane protein (UPF0127 family)